MKRILLLLLMAALLLTGCEGHVNEGVVIDKCYVPAREVARYKVVGLTTIPTMHHIDASWSVAVRGNDNNTGKTVVDWWPVSEAIFESIHVGETVKRVILN